MKTWRSLTRTKANMVRYKTINKEQLKYLEDIIYNHRNEWTPDQVFEMIQGLITGWCEICGSAIFFGKKCKNTLDSTKLNNIENPTIGQIKHYESWNKNAAHEQVKKWCDVCQEENYLFANKCIKCWNRSKFMIDAVKNKNILFWQDEENKRKTSLKIAESARKWMNTPEGKIITANNSKKGWLKEGRKEQHSKRMLKQWKENKEYRESILKKLHSSGGGGGLPKFKEENGILYFLNDETREYEDWEEFKQNKELVKHSELENFIEVTTFRTQESEAWNGKKALFNKLMLDLGYEHFVYIKLDNLGNLITVGETGTFDVNITGVDVDFGEYGNGESNNTPARKYLKDLNRNWDKTRLFIFKDSFESKEEARKKEKEIHEKYGLFMS